MQGEDRLLGGGMEALPANLLPVPVDGTIVRSHGGRSRVRSLCFLTMVTLVLRSDELGLAMKTLLRLGWVSCD